MTLLSAVIISFCIWVLVFDGLSSYRRGGGVLTSYVAILTAPFWAPYFIRLWMIRRKFVVEVSPEGILDRRQMRSPITWNQIRHIRKRSKKVGRGFVEIILIEVSNPQALRSALHWDVLLFRKFTFQAQSEVSIPYDAITGSDTFGEVVDTFWKQLKPSEPIPCRSA
ncbi:MAG: hypothetical protein AB3N22_19370 [Ruegeria sp.]